MRMTLQTWQLLKDGGAPEYMYHDRTVGGVRFLGAKTMDTAKDIQKKMLPIWAAFLCGYPLLAYFLPSKNAQRHAVLSW
jgi:hypothetical protein